MVAMIGIVLMGLWLTMMVKLSLMGGALMEGAWVDVGGLICGAWALLDGVQVHGGALGYEAWVDGTCGGGKSVSGDDSGCGNFNFNSAPVVFLVEPGPADLPSTSAAGNDAAADC